MNAQGNFVQANGIEIYYETFGEGPPLLLLHGGFGNGALQWKDHLPLYAKHFKVIVPDARGHGQTKRRSTVHPNPAGTGTGTGKGTGSTRGFASSAQEIVTSLRRSR